nr:hypothetical protein [Tanacetum cinerariifolium]
ADDLVPIPKESGETSNNDSECNMLDISLPTTDVREDNFVTFSNPLFDTSCYDNSLFDKEFEDISSLDPIDILTEEGDVSLLPSSPHIRIPLDREDPCLFSIL